MATVRERVQARYMYMDGFCIDRSPACSPVQPKRAARRKITGIVRPGIVHIDIVHTGIVYIGFVHNVIVYTYAHVTVSGMSTYLEILPTYVSLNFTKRYYTKLYFTIPYHTIPSHTILCCAVLYWFEALTLPTCSFSSQYAVSVRQFRNRLLRLLLG